MGNEVDNKWCLWREIRRRATKSISYATISTLEGWKVTICYREVCLVTCPAFTDGPPITTNYELPTYLPPASFVMGSSNATDVSSHFVWLIEGIDSKATVPIIRIPFHRANLLKL